MPLIATDNSKPWYGEPAVIKSAIAAILIAIVGVLNGTANLGDAASGIIAALIPLVSGFWIRKSVTPVSSSDV